MSFGLKDRELSLIIQSIQNFDKVEKAVIFGSRARGDYRNSSDVDIAIFARTMTSTEINLLRDQLNQLDIIYKFDVVDFYRLTKARLIEDIEKEGKIIYPARLEI